MSDARLTELEIKVAYLEKSMGELDHVLRDVGDAVDVLRREVKRLREIERDQADKPSVDKPPHY